MRTGVIVLIIVVVLALFGGVWACNKRNSFVRLENAAKAQWKQVGQQYQRRMDLIPNIVATVKGEANFEKSTLEAVVSARARATQANISVENLDESSMQKFKAAQGELSGALSRLLAVSENYPQLQSNRGFADLRVVLESSENRISEERRKYNEAVREYDTQLQLFPGSLLAGGFTPLPYFEADAGAEKAPKVDFQ